MAVLVTGAAGFIGSTLAERLVSDGHDVIGIDNFSDYYPRSIKESNLRALRNAAAFRFVEGDVNTANLRELLPEVEYIFHQAGQPGVRKSWGADFAFYVDANISATQRLLEASREYARKLKSFVYASSSSVYGNAERFPTDETDRPQPRSPYGVSKLAGEHLVSLYAANFSLPTVSLRYFTVYGPRQRPDMAFNRFITLAQRGEELQVFGDGSQIREFTYVDDIVDANVRAATSTVDPGTVVNLSGGTSTSVNEVLELLERIHGRKLNVSRGAPALGDVGRTGGSTARAKRLLRWEPRVDIEKGLALEYDWLAALK